jgi:putative membrane protein
VTIDGWRFDLSVIAPAAVAMCAYAVAAQRFRVLHARRWPLDRTLWFAAGMLSLLAAVESPLDSAGDARFAPHMVQHLILTDVTAPRLLLGAPLLLILSVVSNRTARRLARLLRGPLGRVLGFPPFTWSAFMLVLWGVHFTGFFEAV